MSKKRTSTESSNDEQTTEGSDSVFQQEDNTKRAKLDSLSDTTLQDLPMELIECILVKAVAMEVKGMKLAKSVWKEKADLVISRLRTVCSQWSYILTTNFFRNELHRTLDGIAQETIRLEILHESRVRWFVLEVTGMKDDIVMLSQQRGSIDIVVYDRNNLPRLKDVISLPGVCVGSIAACNVSNCLYILYLDRELHCSSILRITRDEEYQRNIQTWIDDLRCKISSISVSAKGSLMIISRPEDLDLESQVVSIYSQNGFLQHEVMLSPGIDGFRFVFRVIQKSNGNLVIQSTSEQFTTVLTEIDMDGIIKRRYKSSLSARSGVNFADACGRIVINDPEKGIELLDSELNPLDFTGPQPNRNDSNIFYSLHYNGERNEVVGTSAVVTSALTIFRFREE